MDAVRRSKAFLAAVVMGGLSACRGPAPPTQVLVLVDADPLVRAETERVQYVVRGGPADAPRLADREMRSLSGSELDWPFDLTIVPLGQDVSRVFEVEATALDLAGRIVAQVRVRSGFAPGQQRTIRLRMDDRCRGIACDEGETCVAGECVPAEPPAEVDAGVENPDGGTPMPCTGDASCDDGIFCNGVERCVGGMCVPGDRPDCSDRFDCTVDRCDRTGCVHVPDSTRCTAGPGGVCDPGSGCQYDVCDATTCAAGPCERARCDGTRCVRESTCRAGEMCCGSSCQPADCDDGNPCTADVCDPGASVCRHPPRDFPCSDGNACTTGDQCVAGVCQGSGTLSCDDGQTCTLDRCNRATGCEHVDQTGSCDDGNACTVGDACGGGRCVPGAPMPCDDGVACTVDGCSAGACTHEPRDSLCPMGARCDPMMRGCVTTGGCDPAMCSAMAGPCQTAECVGTSCVVRSACATGQMCCGGVCQICDDGNPCTADECSGTGCAHPPVSGFCDDGDPCTTADACTGGTCRGTRRSCDDRNPCTEDTCDSSTGECVYRPLSGPCNDGDACTTGETCMAGMCTGGTMRICDDFNLCTTDSCSSTAGCVYEPRENGADCGDLGGCQRGVCMGGSCVPSGGCRPFEMCCGGSCVPTGTVCE